MSIRSRIERRLSELADDILPDEFRARLSEAKRAWEAGRAAEAAELAEALLRERPDHAGALALLGSTRLDLGHPAAALSAFDRALARAPEHAGGLVGRGHAQLALGDAQASLASYRAGIDAAAGDRDVLASAYRGLGLAYRRLDEIDKAVRELRKAVAEAPQDRIARGALAEALLASGQGAREEAKRHARHVVEEGARAPLAWLTLGHIALEEADRGEAALCYERALEEIDDDDPASGDFRVQALVGLGDAAAQADRERARSAYAEALELSPRRPDLHTRLGEIAELAGETTAALGAHERAADLGGGPEALRRGLDAALARDAIDAAVRFADRLLGEDPDDPRALVAKALALAREGKAEAARATLEAALGRGEDPAARVALGDLELAAGDGRDSGARAAEHARAALRRTPSDPRARALLERARARELGPEAGGPDLYALVAGIAPIARHHTSLAAFATEAAVLKAELDEPLLVTVMGEFSSGKSSFVNTFAGDDVAPTGVTPTTATINIVKYGRERGGRIAHRHGGTEELGWDALQDRLRSLTAQEAREVAYVEILLPLPPLARVHIVDTPGLNSILPEHEEVAKGFVARADAVIWLFSAGQTGKASERRAIEEIRDQGVGVLGVVNKVDQIAPDEAEALRRFVAEELGDLVDAVLPVSAARAREAQLAAGRDEAWEALLSALEERFFARARELKREVGGRRLADLLARMAAIVDREHAGAACTAEALAATRRDLESARAAFPEEVVATERRALAERVKDLYGLAARELLELVRPRRLPFGSHSATPADRDYLLALLDAGFDAALGPARSRVHDTLRARADAAARAAEDAHDVAGDAAARAVASAAHDALKWVDAEAFGRARAFVRGYLRGGYVDRFFQHKLPKLELTEESLHHALLADSPDLDAALAAPLASAGDAALAGLQGEIDQLTSAAEVVALDLDVGLARAIEDHRERLRALNGAG